jgi:hypothetical protein
MGNVKFLKSFEDLVEFSKTTPDQAKRAKDAMYSPENLKEWHSSNNMDGVHTFPPRHVYKTEEGIVRAKDKKEKVNKILDKGTEKKSSEGEEIDFDKAQELKVDPKTGKYITGVEVVDGKPYQVTKILQKNEIIEMGLDFDKAYVGFDKMVDKLKGKGHSEESAKRISAAIGRKKYGKKGMAAKSAAGRK